MTENELIATAEQHEDDEVANNAMNELRDRFDKTYFWCDECDGLVCKEKDCCLNKIKKRISLGQSSSEYIQADGWWKRQLYGLGRLLKR